MKIHTILIPTLLIYSPAMANPFKDINKWGDLLLMTPIFYGVGMTIANEDYKGILQLGESAIVSQLAAEGIKRITHEKRPNGNDYMSFPSGHAAGAFSGAMFVHKRYGWKPALIPYALSLTTGYSRVHAKAHYWHDIAGGAIVSALFTWILVDRYIPKDVSMSADTNGVKIGFNTTF